VRRTNATVVAKIYNTSRDNEVSLREEWLFLWLSDCVNECDHRYNYEKGCGKSYCYRVQIDKVLGSFKSKAKLKTKSEILLVEILLYLAAI